MSNSQVCRLLTPMEREPQEVPIVEPAAYQVWRGLVNMHPIGEPTRSYEKAEAYAANIKSYTEIRPLYYRTPT